MKRKIALGIFLVSALMIGIAGSHQHDRYLSIRQNILQDRQSVFHSPSVFHALYFLRTRPGTDFLSEIQDFANAPNVEGASWIYAGEAIASPRASVQIEAVDWNAVVLIEYPSREAYARSAQSQAMRDALGRFETTYVQGFERPVLFNLAVPQMLLAMRTLDVLRGAPSNFPFKASNRTLPPHHQKMLARVEQAKKLENRPVVIVNLIKDGTPEQVAADRDYTARMLSAMAEGAYGPFHVGNPVQLEGNATFDQVGLVYYPDLDYFSAMLRSEFFQAIVGDKQLGDTQVTVTLPILDRLGMSDLRD
jgi:uncharacterized protein (DUF1330 family)